MGVMSAFDPMAAARGSNEGHNGDRFRQTYRGTSCLGSFAASRHRVFRRRGSAHRRLQEAQDGAAWHFYYSERLFSEDRSQAILQPISIKLPHRLIATYRDTLSH